MEELKKDLAVCEAAKTELWKQLVECRKELHETKSELAKYREAEQTGRMVVLPQGSNCDDCPLCCGDCGGCQITGYPPNPGKCRAIIREKAALKRILGQECCPNQKENNNAC